MTSSKELEAKLKLEEELTRIKDPRLRKILENLPPEDRAYASTSFLNLQKKTSQEEVPEQKSVFGIDLVVLKELHAGFAMENTEGELVYVNPYLAETLGYTVKEMTGMKTIGFIREEDKQLYLDQTNSRKDGGKNSYQIDFITGVDKEDEEIVRTLVSASPMYDSEENYIGNFAVILPVEEFEKPIKEIMSNTLGDWFNNSLAVISLYSQMISRLESDSENFETKREKYVSTIEKEINSLYQKIKVLSTEKLEINRSLEGFSTYVFKNEKPDQ